MKYAIRLALPLMLMAGVVRAEISPQPPLESFCGRIPAIERQCRGWTPFWISQHCTALPLPPGLERTCYMCGDGLPKLLQLQAAGGCPPPPKTPLRPGEIGK
jgi:hypothetical protein